MKNISVWETTAHFKHCKVRFCILEGPEDDSIRIEIYCPNTIINIIKFFLCVTDTLFYIYINFISFYFLSTDRVLYSYNIT